MGVRAFGIGLACLLLSCRLEKPGSSQGPAVSRQSIGTVNLGEKYIAECAAAGVPVPESVLDSTWTNYGEIKEEFLSSDLEGELWGWASSSPQGLCLALPRWTEDGKAPQFGIICQGYRTSKVCFWDNSSLPKIEEDRVWAGTVGYPLSRFVGGYALSSSTQTGGVCTNCHAGANAFVIHPDKPAFQALDLAQRSLLKTASGWYEPIVAASWYQNERRERRLDAIRSDAQCTRCHNAALKTELPELSTALGGLGGYCEVVLETSLSRSSETMPARPVPQGLTYFSYRLRHLNHIRAALDFCRLDSPFESGKTVKVEAGRDDPNFLSPPRILSPIYTCGEGVAISGGVPGATIILTVHNTRTGSKTLFSGTWNEEQSALNFPLPGGLDEDDEVWATQELGSIVSQESEIVEVNDYPDPLLPLPTFAPDEIYKCANTVSVRATPGSRITVSQVGSGSVVVSPGDGWAIVSPGATPWTLGAQFEASAELSCTTNGSLKSWSSKVAFAETIDPPNSLQSPTFDPAQIYEGQTVLGVRTVTFGAFSKMSRLDPGLLILGDTAPAPDGWGANFHLPSSPLNGPASMGDTFSAEPSLYCPSGPVGPPTKMPPVRACELMPAPVIESPRVGAREVAVLQSMPGARIRIWDASGEEVGDGSAPVVVLRRPVVFADEFVATQDAGECRGQSGFAIRASGG